MQDKGRQLLERGSISPGKTAACLSIREFVEAYAHCADRRDAQDQMPLFTIGAGFVLYMSAKDPTPAQELHSPDALAPIFADLNKYAPPTSWDSARCLW